MLLMVLLVTDVRWTFILQSTSSSVEILLDGRPSRHPTPGGLCGVWCGDGLIRFLPHLILRIFKELLRVLTLLQSELDTS